MGKYSNFERIERDFYPTPMAPIKVLSDHLPVPTHFIEPCAGDGALAHHLEALGHHCIDMFDIHPSHPDVRPADALKAHLNPLLPIITNPPWKTTFLHPFIERCIAHGNAWLLFYADWMHTKQASTYMRYCDKVISVGRVKWFADSKATGKENCCWYHFVGLPTTTTFIGR